MNFQKASLDACADAVGIGGAFCRPVVHLERKILEDEARDWFGRDQPFDGRLRGFAGRTLQIAELDNGDRCVFRTARRAGHSLLQHLLHGIEGFGSERNNVADHSVFAVSCNEEPAGLLALGAGKNHVDLGEAGHRRGFNAGDFPTQPRLISESLLQERIHGGFGRQIDAGRRRERIRGLRGAPRFGGMARAAQSAAK